MKKRRMSNKRLMIVDANNQFLRSYIVDPSISSHGEPIGGSKGFLKILNKLTRIINPYMTVVVWDGQGGSQKRRAVNKNYKAGRKPVTINPKVKTYRLNRGHGSEMTPEQEAENRAWQQFRVVEYINQTPMVQFMEPNVEADDVISYVSQMSSFKDWQKVIVSSDKDFIQLLDSNTILYRPTQKEVLNKNKIIERFGIHPNNFAISRAMAGDASDKLPGVPGVGLATVAKRFKQLIKPEEVLLDELEAYCRQVDSDESNNVGIYAKILDHFDTVKENYKIMQLSSPMLSIQGKTRINETFRDYQPAFNKTGLRTEMFKDGTGEISLNDMFENFNRLISAF